MGFRVKLGNCVIGDGKMYTSATTEKRVAELHRFFLDPDVRMIMTGIGGNHSNHVIGRLDYALIRKHPKIVIGYSDITVLHYALYVKAGLASFYGPCAATQFGEYPDLLDYTKRWFQYACVEDNHKERFDTRSIPASRAWTDEFLDWFQQHDRTRPRRLVRNPGYRWLNKGKSSGGALPGCILSMNRLAGTPYWIDPRNKILFLDVLTIPGELSPEMVHSFLTDLGNIGVFDVIKGLVVGRAYGYSKEEKKALFRQINLLTKKKYPIVTEFDIGHTDPMVTIRYGQRVRLDSDREEVIFY